MTTQAAEQRSVLPHRRWRIAWLLGIGVLINYFDRVNLSVSHSSLIAAFGISNVVFGYLSAAYNWTYAVCQLPIGVVLDRWGVRRVQRAGTFLWSVATFAAAATPTLGGLFGARLLLGVAEAPTFPANAKAIGAWFPAKKRSMATSLFDSAAKLASAIGVPLIGVVLIRAGWRWSFALTGALSLAYFLFFWRVYREPHEDRELSEAEREYIAGGPFAEDREAAIVGANEDAVVATPVTRAAPPSSGLFTLLGRKKVLGLALGFGAYNYVFYLLLTWLPSYLSFALHINLLDSFLYTSVPWFVGTFTDVTIGGWLVDTLVHRGWNASTVRRVVLIGGTAFGLGIIGAAHAHDATHALLWISISLGGLSAAAPVGWSLPSLIAGPNDVGTVGGIINFSSQLSGIAAPIITGYVVTARHSYAWAFGVSAIYLVIGIAGYVFLLGRIEPPADAV